MLKRHPFNREESLRVYQECADIVKYKECYANVYNVAAHFAHLFHDKEWKVAYGYIRISPDNNMWARHAFIVNKQGGAIDPTYFSHENHFEGELKQHTSFYIFNDITRYATVVERNKNFPDLLQPLRKQEEKMGEWAKANNMVLFGGIF